MNLSPLADISQMTDHVLRNSLSFSESATVMYNLHSKGFDLEVEANTVTGLQRISV